MNELELKKIESEVPTILEVVQKKTILTDGDIVPVIEIIREVKKREKIIEDYMNPIIKAAHNTHKLAVARKNQSLKPLVEIRELADEKIKQFKLKQLKQAEKEREELEFKRLQKEAREKEKLLQKAEKEREKGNIEKAELLEEQAEDVEFMTPMIQVQDPTTKFKDESGKSTLTLTKDFDIEVIDFNAFLNAIIQRKMSKSSIKIVDSEVKKHIKSMDFDKKECLNFGIRIIDKIKSIVRG